VTLNLLIGFSLLLPIAIINWLVPLPIVSRGCFAIVDCIYRAAVWLDSFWMQKVVGIELLVVGQPSLSDAPIVICNHQSWFDIPLVQEVITGNGPIVKFLLKQEIIWIPIIGWICLALNFPRLQRNKYSNSRENDFSIISQASKKHRVESGALLIFPEGTRFSESKKINQKAPYKYLLKPKAGGLKIIKRHAKPGSALVDITIDYQQKNVSIWNCLHGNPKKIVITLRHYLLDDIDNVEQWLNNCWLEKDQILSNIRVA
jgi:1-acyl-sn-glycerol-3-phosphate acyltransferase